MRYILAWMQNQYTSIARKYWFNHFLLSRIWGSKADKFAPWLQVNESLIVDSWAFSVWTVWQKIDIDKYWRYAVELNKTNKGKEIYYVSLDVIPGSFWRKPTKEQREESAKQSYEQRHYLKDTYKVRWMPVFHQHEDFVRLQKYIDDGVDYLGISPANDCTPSERLKWLKRVFYKYLIKTKVKTHGFGVTTLSIIKEIPFYSCDSTSWMSSIKYNCFLYFDKGCLYNWQAKVARVKIGIDLAKLSDKEKIERNIRNVKKMEEYVNSIHKIHSLDYYNR